MKIILLLVTVFVTVSSVSYKNVLEQEWSLYKAEYNKNYENYDEDRMRFKIFLENKMVIAEHNQKFIKKEVTFEMGINHLSDFTLEEFDRINGLNKPYRDGLKAGKKVVPPNTFLTLSTQLFNGTVPEELNWVEKNAIYPVKDQGLCGSCYAFGALGSLESIQYLKTQKMIGLSEQNIIDCTIDFGNYGCDGGLVENVFKYVKQNEGVSKLDKYPYEGYVKTCRYKREDTGAYIQQFYRVNESEEELQKTLANVGPIAVAIQATTAFIKYKKGVLVDDTCTNEFEDLNHSVLLVGYGNDPKTNIPYWLIKNSWGTDWGIKGYAKLARNRNNMCGIASYAMYPKIP